MATVTTNVNYSTQVEIVDSDAALAIQCANIQNQFDSTPNSSPVKENTVSDLQEENLLRSIRGTIIENKSQKIVFEGSFFPYEFTELDLDRFKENVSMLGNDFKDMDIGYSYEGTIIRIFYYNKWYVSTHRKLDAGRSKWGSNVSFRTLFENALAESYNMSLKDLTTTLNLRCQYTFLLLADENTKFACEVNPNFKKVYFVDSNDPEKRNIKLDVLPKPQITFSTAEEVFAHVGEGTQFRYPFSYQGLLLTHKSGAQYRIVSSEYVHYFKVRDNQQSIQFRYLQLKGQNNHQDIELLKKLFPKYQSTFDNYDRYISRIVDIIFENFRKRKQGELLDIPQPFYLFIKNNLMTLPNTTVNTDLITQLIFEQPSPVINNMIKVVKFDQKKEEYEKNLILKVEELKISQIPTNAPKKKRVKYTPIPVEFSCKKKLF